MATSCNFIVVADPQQLHLIRVPVEPAAAGAVPPPTAAEDAALGTATLAS